MKGVFNTTFQSNCAKGWYFSAFYYVLREISLKLIINMHGQTVDTIHSGVYSTGADTGGGLWGL